MLAKNSEKLNDFLKLLPKKAGVYRYYDKNNKLLYVGKAKNLKNRVNSYFKQKLLGARLKLLVSQIADIRYTVVSSSHEALLLERNLIKSEKPKYNIQLRDDKSYPHIVVKNEALPRVYFTRKKEKDKSEYFGPYTSVVYTRKVLDTIKNIFPLRTCTLNLSKENIAKGKFKECLEYHIGNCLAPCTGKQSYTEYEFNIKQIRNILNGQTTPVVKILEQKMQECVEVLDFEEAHEFKKKIEALEQYGLKTSIANTKIKNADFYHILEADKVFFVQHLKVLNGSIVGTKTYELKNKLDETPTELLEYVIEDYQPINNAEVKEIVTPFAVETGEIKNSIGNSGEREKILKLCYRNLIAHKLHFQDLKIKNDEKPEAKMRVMEQLKKDLRLVDLPRHIECFDNSNIQGTNPVASMVCFKNAKPSKKDYRHYKIKTVVGIDDFASMEEIVYRRYSRLQRENAPLPNLIIVDGGKGQLSSALKSLKKLDLIGKIPIVGIAKRLEEIYYPGDSIPLYINKKSESLKLIQFLRNEAHRFAITFHRDQRSKNLYDSEIEKIKGIGKKTSELLLKEFGSVTRIKQATEKELLTFIAPSKVKLIKDYFKANQ
ncbi:MAG: excinuclease ABC subunit UvrC [Chitinophagales bacterium]